MQHDSDRGDNDDEAGHNLGNADTAEHFVSKNAAGLVPGSSLIQFRTQFREQRRPPQRQRLLWASILGKPR